MPAWLRATSCPSTEGVSYTPRSVLSSLCAGSEGHCCLCQAARADWPVGCADTLLLCSRPPGTCLAFALPRLKAAGSGAPGASLLLHQKQSMRRLMIKGSSCCFPGAGLQRRPFLVFSGQCLLLLHTLRTLRTRTCLSPACAAAALTCLPPAPVFCVQRRAPRGSRTWWRSCASTRPVPSSSRCPTQPPRQRSRRSRPTSEPLVIHRGVGVLVLW